VSTARAAAASNVSQRIKSELFIITSSPESGSKKKFPLNPVTTGGAPVTIAALFTLVNEGNAPRTIPRQPPSKIRAKLGDSKRIQAVRGIGYKLV